MKEIKINKFVYLFITLCCAGLIVFRLFFSEGDLKIRRGNHTTVIPKENDPKTDMEFLSDIDIDFKSMTKGEKRNFDYTVKNIGKKPLLIYDVVLSCQCTSYSVSKRVILPQDTAVVTLNFDSADKKDFLNVQALLITNTKPRSTKLSFYGFVKPKIEEERRSE